jgi:isochorismate hydrolase
VDAEVTGEPYAADQLWDFHPRVDLLGRQRWRDVAGGTNRRSVRAGNSLDGNGSVDSEREDRWEAELSTLPNRSKTALLVVDVQNGVVADAHARDAVVANIGNLVEKARQEQVPVVWVQHSDEQLARGSDEWKIVPELKPDGEEPIVEKNYGDSFEDTTLENVLSDLRVARLVVVGAQTDACIRSTLHGAFVRGYDAMLVSDAHTTEDQTAWGAPPPDQVIAHTNLYWQYQTAPGRTAGTVEAKQVEFD